jgi:hypothetical protein
MLAHRRRREAERLSELPRPPGPFPEKLDGAAPAGIGERRQYAIQRRGRHSYIFAVRPLARSHSSGVTFFTVWPNVQM